MAKKFKQKVCNNLWIVDQGSVITGLVYPKTRKEAEKEMARLKITGDLYARVDYEQTAKYQAFMLGDQRARIQHAIRQRADILLEGNYRVFRQLAEMVMPNTIKPTAMKKVETAQYAANKIKWAETASASALDNYDPSTDSNWPE